MKIFKLIACVFLLPLIGYTQPVTFTKFYDYGIDACFSVLELNDGYLMASMAGQPIFPKYVYLIKTDFGGDTLWRKQQGDSNHYNVFYSLIKTYDGNFVTGSYRSDVTYNSAEIYITKYNNTGDTVWTSIINAPQSYHYNGQYLIETSDKGFLITSQKVDTSATIINGALIKTDSVGHLEWTQTYGGNDDDNLSSSVELPDGGFLSIGWTYSFGLGKRDIYLIKTDSLGNLIWQKTYGTVYFDTGYGITATNDGNYLLAGDKGKSVGHFPWILKIDTAGTIIWENTYSNSNAELWWARELNDGAIAAVGSVTGVIKDSAFIVKADNSGNKLWDRAFLSNNDHSYFRDFKQTADSGFICTGFVFVGASGNQDSWLIKLDSLGCDSAGCATYTGVGIAELQPPSAVQFYPNPFSSEAIIKFKNKLNEKVTLTIYDIMGNVIEKQYTVSSEFIIFKNTKATGVYFYNLFYDETKRVERGKFVIGG